MSFVTLAEAKTHLRVDGTDEDALIGLYINAAEQSAMSLLDRGVYVDGTALGAAKAAAPGGLESASAAYDAAIEAAQAMTDDALQAAATQAAENAWLKACVTHRQTMDGRGGASARHAPKHTGQCAPPTPKPAEAVAGAASSGARAPRT